MYWLTHFSRSGGSPLSWRLLIRIIYLLLLFQSGLPVLVVAAAPMLQSSATFQQVETFDGLSLGAVNGQNGWRGSNSISVVSDPENSANRVLLVDRGGVEAYKALPTSIADTSTGTVYFRLRRDGHVDGFGGSSAQSAPTDFPTFETQFGSQVTQTANTFMVRDGATFKALGNNFTDRTWHCVWLVANNQANTYEVYVKGGAYTTTTRLEAAGQTAFAFRNGGANPLRTFFTRAGEQSAGDYYIDDIYVDATAANLAVPGTDCGTAGDTTAPTVTWTSPVSSGQAHQAGCGTTVSLAVTATDAGGVNRVEFSRWDAVASVQVPLATVSTPPYQSGVDVCSLNFGWNEIDVAAIDQAGNRTDDYIWIRRNAPPTVNAGADQTITLPAGATLTGAVTDDSLPEPPAAVTVAWSRQSGPGTVTFANGAATSTTATFSTSGIYTIRLTANDGQFVTTDDLLIAVNGGATAPTPAFVADKTVGVAPLTVNFTDQSSGTITSWAWNFGDGGVSVVQNPSYTYAAAGEYTVSLTVSGPGGANTKIVSAYIRLTPPPPGQPSVAAIENSDQNGNYTIAWGAIANATAYELQEQLNGGSWTLIYSGTATNHTVTNKANGNWCYQARALNTAISSEWSSAQCVTVNTPTLAQLYLPMVLNAPPVIPQVGWQLLGQGNLNAQLLMRQGDTLFVGERKEGNFVGGLYSRSLNDCSTSPTFSRFSTIDSSVLGLDYQGAQAVVAAYDQGVYYSTDNGNSWLLSSSKVTNPRSVAISTGNIYVGTEEDGLFASPNGGRTWTNRSKNPKNINTLQMQDTTLWVGTNNDGVAKLLPGSNDPIGQSSGLTRAGSGQIWDFAFDTNNTIYVATSDGVYQSNVGTVFWQPFGLQNTELRSLLVVGDQLYAGVKEQGVWRRPLNGGDWAQVTNEGWGTPPVFVRDLYYEPSCDALFAATSAGVWIYSPVVN